MPFDLAAFLRGLDAIFAAHEGPTRAEPYLRAGLARAEVAADDGARLSILNELAGFYRSAGRHDEAVQCAEQALALVGSAGMAGTDAHATTLINLATAQRAAGRPDDALAGYSQALAIGVATMAPTDRRLAALHNNLSFVFSERGEPQQAVAELAAALAILTASSPDPSADLDVASTHTNLALVLLQLGDDEQAADHADRSLQIFAAGRHEQNPHYASALAGAAQVAFRRGEHDRAVECYRHALAIVAECYGTGSDAYAITAANLAAAQAAAPLSRRPAAHPAAGARPTGLQLARALWQTYGAPMLAERYSAYRGRIAVGLVGHGSDCYGFDDELSRDHDHGPGFCLWLTAADHAAIGAALAADYAALPRELAGVGPRVSTPRSGQRVGVLEIGAFFEGLTGYRQAPSADRPHEWLALDEATLAAATNGQVFADPLGAFSAVRDGFRRMPADVRLALVSRRLGMMAQAGQNNVPRMLARGDGAAAWLCVAEFVRATASLVFLLNKPESVGYLPYYKWQPAALRRLSARMGSRLPQVAAELDEVQRLAGAACFRTDGPDAAAAGARASDAEAGTGSATRLSELVELICAQVVAELRARGLTRSDATFLEWQRPFVAEHIADEWLRSL